MKYINKFLMNEYCWVKEKVITYYKNPLFIIWIIFAILVLYRIWYIYIFFLVYISSSVLFLLIKKDPEIIFTKNKKNIFINYFKINMLKSIENAKYDKKIIPIFLFFYLFKQIFKISYKFLRITISLFDCFYREYEWSNIKNKKKTKKIIKIYISRSIENWAFLEFIKQTPKLEKELIIYIRKKKK